MSTRIVLVDDEADLVWSTRRRLESTRPDYRVEGFTDPEAALRRIAEEAPDALVTDLRMPTMSGLDLLVRARAAVPGLPAVVITAFGSPEARAEVRRRGSVEYLEKPCSLESLMSTIDGALARRRGFSGAVSLSLADIVQMHALARFTGTLLFTNGGDQASLHFAAGDIIDAECEGLRGAPAVYASLAWQGGGFVARPGETSRERTITDNWQAVLMEGCRRLDEGGRGTGDAGTATGGDSNGELEGQHGEAAGDRRLRGGGGRGQQQRDDAGLERRRADQPGGGGGRQHGGRAVEDARDVAVEAQRLDRGHPDHAGEAVPPDPSGGVEGRALHLSGARPREGQPGDGTPSPGRGRGHADGLIENHEGKGETQMATEKEILETFNKIEAEVGGFIACSLVDLDSGMTLAVRSVRGEFDLAAASAYNSEMVKQKLKTIKALNLKSTLDDMLLTLSDQIHFIKMVTPRTFLYLAADKSGTNLAIVRSSVMKYVGALA
jgi:CheY-like chemotaxis protein